MIHHVRSLVRKKNIPNERTFTHQSILTSLNSFKESRNPIKSSPNSFNLNHQNFVILHIQLLSSIRDVTDSMTWLHFADQQRTVLQSPTDVKRFALLGVSSGECVHWDSSVFSRNPTKISAEAGKNLEILFGVGNRAPGNDASLVNFRNQPWSKRSAVMSSADVEKLSVTLSGLHGVLRNVVVERNPNWNFLRIKFLKTKKLKQIFSV